MSQLTLTIVKIGFLALLWLFVLSAISVMRSDLFGTRVVQRVVSTRASKGSSRPATTSSRSRREGSRRRGKAVPHQLVVTAGPLAGTAVTLSEAPVVIGRAPECTLVLDDSYTSSRHARLRPTEDGTWTVEDLGSTNGTYLGPTKVSSPTVVPVGEPIRIGKTVLELRR
ncbi:MAG: FHA domain-containing protein FhaB/FipA [Actinomycetes bacterium]